MKKLVLYPSPTKLNKINNHQNVCAFFLRKYLKKYFDVIDASYLVEEEERISNIDNNKTDEIFIEQGNIISKIIYLSHKVNADYFLTTIQAGIMKIPDQRYNQLRANFPNIKFISIHDHWGSKKYKEDYLLISHENNDPRVISKLKNSAQNKNIQPVYIGWCADHEIFKPVKNDFFGVVLDHSALQSFRKDLTNKYLEELCLFNKQIKNLRVCRINKGFEFYDFKNNAWSRDESLRWWEEKLSDDKKIKNGEGATIFQIAECLGNSKIFCVTHVESCGLTGIESLMAGCKLYVPKGRDRFQVWGTGSKTPVFSDFNGEFIKKGLLKPYMNYRIFNEDDNITSLFKEDYNNLLPVKKELIINNSWESAAKRIAAVLK